MERSLHTRQFITAHIIHLLFLLCIEKTQIIFRVFVQFLAASPLFQSISLSKSLLKDFKIPLITERSATIPKEIFSERFIPVSQMVCFLPYH